MPEPTLTPTTEKTANEPSKRMRSTRYWTFRRNHRAYVVIVNERAERDSYIGHHTIRRNSVYVLSFCSLSSEYIIGARAGCCWSNIIRFGKRRRDEKTAKETQPNKRNVTIAHGQHNRILYGIRFREEDRKNIAETKAINIPKTKDIKLR